MYGRSCNGPVEGGEVIYAFTGDSQGFRDFQLGACLGHALRVHSSVIAVRLGVKNIHADFVGAVVCDTITPEVLQHMLSTPTNLTS